MIRAAFATGDGININRHFGIADRFDIYEIDVENKKYELVDTRRIDSYGVSLQHDDSLIERLAEAIDDCNIVFSAKSGLHAKQALDEKLIQAVDVEKKVEFVLERVVSSRISILAPKYKAEKPRKVYERSVKQGAFENLQKRHPCLGGHSNVTAGRVHLPVSPVCNISCKFCTRAFNKSEIKPGVSSLVLKPEEAVETVRKAKELCPELTVVGIAGPGDTLANDQALKAFKLVKEEFPDLICCLSTNGFRLADKIEEIAKIGIETLTVTVNAVDPEIEAQINNFVIDEHGNKHDGIEGARLLIEKQLEGIRLAAKKGIVVKINSVLVPGINDKHIPEVAKVTSELGASILNIIPLIPQNEMKDIPAPTCADLEEVRAEAGKYLEVFRHCQHCRADSLGIPGKGKDLHNELYKDRKERAADTFSHG